MARPGLMRLASSPSGRVLVLLPLVLVLDLLVVLALGLLPLNSVAGLQCDPLLRGGEPRSTERLAAPIRASADKLCSDAANGRRGALIAVGLIVLLFGTGAVLAPADRLERALVRSREDEYDEGPSYDPAQAQADLERRQREEREASERRAAWSAGLGPQEQAGAELAPVAVGELPPGVMGELEAPKPAGAAAKRSRTAKPSGVKATKAKKVVKAKKVTAPKKAGTAKRVTAAKKAGTAKRVTAAKKAGTAKRVVTAGAATKATKATKSIEATKAAKATKAVSARGASARLSKVGATRGGPAQPTEAEVVSAEVPEVPEAPTKAGGGRRAKMAKAAASPPEAAAAEAAPAPPPSAEQRAGKARAAASAGRTTTRPRLGTRGAGSRRLAPVRAPVDAEPAPEVPATDAPAEPIVADAPDSPAAHDGNAETTLDPTVEVPVVEPEPTRGGPAARTGRTRSGTRSVAGTRSRRR